MGKHAVLMGLEYCSSFMGDVISRGNLCDVCKLAISSLSHTHNFLARHGKSGIIKVKENSLNIRA